MTFVLDTINYICMCFKTFCRMAPSYFKDQNILEKIYIYGFY